MDEAAWTKMDSSFMQSPLANILQREGVELHERRVHNLPRRTWRIQKPLAYGISEPVLTILGKERGRSSQGKRGWREILQLTDDLSAMVSTLPTHTQITDRDKKKMHTSRGILDVEELGTKMAKYTTAGSVDVDPAAIAEFEEYMVDTWDKLGKELRGNTVKLNEVATWSSQFPSNKNSGWPYNMPISKERLMNVDWPNFRQSISQLLSLEDMQPEDIWKAIPQAVKNANLPIFMAGARSPDRPIFMTRLWAKVIGAFMNYNVVNGLSGNCDIAWQSIHGIHKKTMKALSHAISTLYIDFKGYDTTWSLELIKALLRAYKRSTFASDNLELRNAILFMLYEIAQPSTLQVSPTRFADLRSTLWSGISGTQLFGSVVHLSVYPWIMDKLGIDFVNIDVLSDDGKAESTMDPVKLKEAMLGPITELVKGLGLEVHPDKSYVADMETTVEVGVRNGESVEYSDSGVFLQFHMGRNFLYGNGPRRKWSLYEKERDSSQDAMYDLVKKHTGALRSVRAGNTIPETYFDLYRCASIISTLGPDYPLIDEVHTWFTKTWPSFDKRFSKMYDTVDSELWKADVPAAGGTLQSGFTVNSVVGEWMDLINDDWEPVWD
jgi:hypothetical protein